MPHPASKEGFQGMPLASLADRLGTPYYLYDAESLRKAIARVRELAGPGLAVRFAMKACSARAVLTLMREAGFWIDAVSGNEALRARGAGFPGGTSPPVILLTAD